MDAIEDADRFEGLDGVAGVRCLLGADASGGIHHAVDAGLGAFAGRLK